jgi:hypothetical protein
MVLLVRIHEVEIPTTPSAVSRGTSQSCWMRFRRGDQFTSRLSWKSKIHFQRLASGRADDAAGEVVGSG